ncbi:TlpA disulfide reductase family protein [Candidatus Pelagibacter sp.]|nr:TlpA disulfide reductase family protein [Candidatus Pelagibacter sp.]|tara:strand:+ start:166 stop:681 length:516 start_codon:yes stop_codon:yes gene_type:complete
MKFLIIFIFLINTNFTYAIEKPNIKNLVLISPPKTHEGVIFKDKNQKNVDLADYKGKLLILNFWATWCTPCKEEMPSLNNLQSNARLNNLKIFPINIGQEDLLKSQAFFKELAIENLDIYFDPSVNLAKKFKLRGVPTTIFFDKEGSEFARVIGSADFITEEFINWLELYN